MLDRAGLEGQTETSDPITCPSMAGGQTTAQMRGRLAGSFSPLLNVFYGNVFASLKSTHTSSVCTHAHTHRIPTHRGATAALSPSLRTSLLAASSTPGQATAQEERAEAVCPPSVPTDTPLPSAPQHAHHTQEGELGVSGALGRARRMHRGRGAGLRGPHHTALTAGTCSSFCAAARTV